MDFKNQYSLLFMDYYSLLLLFIITIHFYKNFPFPRDFHGFCGHQVFGGAVPCGCWPHRCGRAGNNGISSQQIQEMQTTSCIHNILHRNFTCVWHILTYFDMFEPGNISKEKHLWSWSRTLSALERPRQRLETSSVRPGIGAQGMVQTPFVDFFLV